MYMVFERRDVTGEWVSVGPPSFEYHGNEVTAFEFRNYSMFGLLAGVRRVDAGQISEPRGLPEDASEATASLVDDNDLHSQSWLMLDELDRDYTGEQTNTLGDMFFLSLAACRAADVERIVFCFDN